MSSFTCSWFVMKFWHLNKIVYGKKKGADNRAEISLLLVLPQGDGVRRFWLHDHEALRKRRTLTDNASQVDPAKVVVQYSLYYDFMIPWYICIFKEDGYRSVCICRYFPN